MNSTCYDGTVIHTAEYRRSPGAPVNPTKTARLHRWAVREYLYSTGINRLPRAQNWRNA